MSLFFVLILVEHPPGRLGVRCGRSRNQAEFPVELWQLRWRRTESDECVKEQEGPELIGWAGGGLGEGNSTSTVKGVPLCLGHHA